MRTNAELINNHSSTFRIGERAGSPNRRLFRPHFVNYKYDSPDKC